VKSAAGRVPGSGSGAVCGVLSDGL
jgi:hypothetical protein